MRPDDPVIVVFVPNPVDWAIARQKNWYRMPVQHGPAEISAKWIAFYFPGAFGKKRRGIFSFARITGTEVVRRIDLLPEQPHHRRAQEPYHVISFERPMDLARPLRSENARRFVYTFTTVYRLGFADGVDELFDATPLLADASNNVLVSIVPTENDFQIVREQGWYRIPLGMVKKWSAPGYLAFYFGRGFGDSAGQVRWYAPVANADLVKRIDMFPDDEDHPRAFNDYVRVHISDLRPCPHTITSRSERKLVLLSTTMDRLESATDLNELSCGDGPVDALYGEFTKEGLFAERDYYVRGANAYYLTDMALLCRKKSVQIDIEPAENDDGSLIVRGGPKHPATGWEAIRLSRYDITRRRGEVLESVRSAVNSSGGMIIS
jgi:hypothetical protein